MVSEESKGDLSEGDVNLSSRRAEWVEKNLDEETRRLLEEDSRLFLHQSLSTPCLDVLASCDGVYIENLQGRRLMDFHGNNVHQVGFSHPRVVKAVKDQLDKLSFCTRRYTNLPAIKLARALSERAPGDLDQGAPLSRRCRGHGHGIEACKVRYGKVQDHQYVGFLSRRFARHDFDRRGGFFSRRYGAAVERCGTCAAA